MGIAAAVNYLLVQDSPEYKNYNSNLKENQFFLPSGLRAATVYFIITVRRAIILP